MRETLFNWLGDRIRGARCLDLFAGSGALGLEALSRGAAEVVFVDRDPRIGQHLRATLQRFGCDRARVYVESAWDFLERRSGQFDVAFIDPPFAEGWAERACEVLAAGAWLAPGALIYIETPVEQSPPSLPEGWELLRQSRAGQVGYHLARASAGGETLAGTDAP